MRLLLDCKGKLIVSGLGKSGHIGRKIAATFASTGTTATFLHLAEAIHGDLGMACAGDVRVPIRIEFSPDGRVAAISEPDRHRVVVLDARTRKTLATVDLAAAGYKVPVTMLFAPDGKRLWVAATGSGAVAEIDTKSWRIMRRLAAGKGADGLAFSRVDSRP